MNDLILNEKFKNTIYLLTQEQIQIDIYLQICKDIQRYISIYIYFNIYRYRQLDFVINHNIQHVFLTSRSHTEKESFEVNIFLFLCVSSFNSCITFTNLINSFSTHILTAIHCLQYKHVEVPVWLQSRNIINLEGILMHVSVSLLQSAKIDLKTYAKQSKLKFSPKHMSAHTDVCTEGAAE